MRRFIGRCICTAALLAIPLGASAAEGFKVKPLQTVIADEKGGDLKYPEGVACDGKSLVVVADTGNSRLVRYTYQDESLKGGSEIKIPQLTYPLRVQVAAGGAIFALDGKQRRIVRLNGDGTFSGYMEPKGVSGGQGVIPRSFRVDGAGNIWILDILGARVLQLDGGGNVLRQVEFPKDYGFISDIEVTASGDVLLLDSTNAAVFAARKGEGTALPLSQGLRDYLVYPTYLATDSRGMIYVVDQNGGALVALGGDGSFVGRQLAMGTKNGLLNYPGQFCIMPAGALLVADRNNSRLQLFTLGR
ncbi:MAG TPA: NHL repeat-containing protein [Geobacteraceae bacterium]|nr:NHL repeat-containing protein [Geobacteraceae bacterium]